MVSEILCFCQMERAMFVISMVKQRKDMFLFSGTKPLSSEEYVSKQGSGQEKCPRGELVGIGHT